MRNKKKDRLSTGAFIRQLSAGLGDRLAMGEELVDSVSDKKNDETDS